jgi:hypothetical protein
MSSRLTKSWGEPATLAETESIDDLILGRLPEVAPVALSVHWGFEKFDGVARGIL